MISGHQNENNFFLGNQNGNIAVIFSLTATILIGSTGLAVDYIRAVSLNTRLQSAADFAVLAALNPNVPVEDPVEQARELFLSTLSSSDASRIINVSTSIMSDDYGSLNTLNLNYRADISSTLLRILGFPTVPVTGKSASTIGTYYSARFHFLVDASDSMGLAATEADRNQLINLTQSQPMGGCEFACHSSTRLNIARANDITLRIDVAKAGVMRVIDLASTHSTRTDQFRFSLQSIGTNATVIEPSTVSFDEIRSAVTALEVGYGHPSGEDANTFFDIASPRQTHGSTHRA